MDPWLLWAQTQTYTPEHINTHTQKKLKVTTRMTGNQEPNYTKSQHEASEVLDEKMESEELTQSIKCLLYTREGLW